MTRLSSLQLETSLQTWNWYVQVRSHMFFKTTIHTCSNMLLVDSHKTKQLHVCLVETVYNFQYNIDKTYPCWVWLYFASLVPTHSCWGSGNKTILYCSAHLPVNSGSGWYVTMFVKCLVNTKVHYRNRPGLVLTHVDQCVGLNLNSCHITSAQIAFVPSSPECQVHAWTVDCVVQCM